MYFKDLFILTLLSLYIFIILKYNLKTGIMFYKGK